MKGAIKPRIEIMAIGSELLTPYYQDTNSLYLTQRLNDLGLELSHKSIVSDDWEEILLRAREAVGRSDVLIAIGGLGPTEDDRTREVFSHVLGRRLVFKRDVLQDIKQRFKRRGLAMPPPNKKQAYIIEGADIFPNRNGTAPGQWLKTGEKAVLLLPGPPQELQPMFEEHAWPRFAALQKGFLARSILKMTGLTESQIEVLISDLYPKGKNLRVTTLAYPGQIEIHLTSFSAKSRAAAEKNMFRLRNSLVKRLHPHVFSISGEAMEEVLGKLLREHGKTLSVAESCTGGFLGHRLTNIPGSSDYFLQGFIVYSNKAKAELLGVPESLIRTHGAVSEEAACAMAEGARAKASSDYGLAVTGIAGPSGGTPQKPVGLVFMALAWEGGVSVEKSLFLGGREQIKFQSAQKVMDMLRRHILR